MTYDDWLGEVLAEVALERKEQGTMNATIHIHEKNISVSLWGAYKDALPIEQAFIAAGFTTNRLGGFVAPREPRRILFALRLLGLVEVDSSEGRECELSRDDETLIEVETLFAERDGVPVVRIDTPGLEDGEYGPKCRIYINDAIQHEGVELPE